MPRQAYLRSLRGLEQDTLALGDKVLELIRQAVTALRQRDLAMARQLVGGQAAIAQGRRDLQERCVMVMATQQPAAGDLRQIIAVLNIALDLERIGDYAEGIARIALRLGTEPLVKPLIDIPLMAEKASDMLRRSLVAFEARDAEAARRICAEDDEVDALCDQVDRELLLLMLQDPRQISGATHLIWVAHNLERIADRATNICERTVYTVTGKMEEIASKY